MKKYLCIILSAIIIFSVFSLAACQKKEKENETEQTETTAESRVTKSTTAVPVRIVDIPTSKEEQVNMLNSALDFFDLYCYEYTKGVKCTVSDVSVGSLSAASNAQKAFKSIFGERDTSNDYNYQTAQESFEANAMESGFSTADVALIDAKQEGNEIVLTATFANETNPNDTAGQLHKLTSEYIGIEKVNSSLSEFSSSANSVNIAVSDITVSIRLNSFDSSLNKLTVSFTEKFSLGSVRLVQLEGSSVTGTAKTTVTYSNLK